MSPIAVYDAPTQSWRFTGFATAPDADFAGSGKTGHDATSTTPAHTPATLAAPANVGAVGTLYANGDYKITGAHPTNPGGKWTGLDFARRLFIDATGIVVEDCRIANQVLAAWAPGATGGGGRDVPGTDTYANGPAGADLWSVTMRWCTIGRSSIPTEFETAEKHRAVRGCGGNAGITFYRCNMFGLVDGMFLNVNNKGATLEECWVHDPWQNPLDPDQPSDTGVLQPSHNDAFQTMQGKTILIKKCRIDWWNWRTPQAMGANRGTIPAPYICSEVMLFRQKFGVVDDVIIDGNIIDGDYYRTMQFIRDGRATGPTNVQIKNNIIVRRWPQFGRLSLLNADTPGNITWTNNKDDQGLLIPAPTGTINGDL